MKTCNWPQTVVFLNDENKFIFKTSHDSTLQYDTSMIRVKNPVIAHKYILFSVDKLEIETTTQKS